MTQLRNEVDHETIKRCPKNCVNTQKHRRGAIKRPQSCQAEYAQRDVSKNVCHCHHYLFVNVSSRHSLEDVILLTGNP